MRTLVAFLFLVPVACGGGVTSDPASGEPPPSNTILPPPPPPTTKAQSLLCAGAPIFHTDEVALWYASGTELTFVRHDGTAVVVHHAENDQQQMTAEVGAAGDHIAALVRQTGAQSNLYLFDRRANLIALQVFAEDIFDLRVGAKHIGFSIGVDDASEGRIWDGTSAPASLGSWTPIAPPRDDGWVPVRKGWDSSAEFGFVGPGAAFQSFPAEDPVYSVAGTLLTIDQQAWKLLIGSPSEIREISLLDFGGGDIEPPYIRETRKEGWVSIQRYSVGVEVADILVVNAVSGETRSFPGDPGNGQPLSFYCNAGFPGFLASDGTLLRSHISQGQLQLQHDGEPVGLPLSNVAGVWLRERAGTVVMLGSDGSDTYCGTPESWPAKPGTLAGNSLQTLRHGVARLGEFTETFNLPEIDASGACTLTHQWDTDGYRVRIDDLDGQSSSEIDLGKQGQWAQWVE